MTDISEKKIDIVCHNCDPSAATQVPDALIRSEGELLSIKARQKKVHETLQKLSLNIKKDEEPPVIAILGSGGGLRAMVGLLGVLAELAKADLLDAVTYICGTSGSTWCMSSLYNNEKWSSCMEEMEHEISGHLLKPLQITGKTKEILRQTASKEIYSLTYFWAYTIVRGIINDPNENKLSDHKKCCESGENPYPVYSAVEIDSLKSNKPGTWFEFTPHMVGFPAYKTFVTTDLLGSEFKEGKLVEKHPERDLCYLQGMWGSALASEMIIKQTIKEKIQSFLPNLGRREDPLLPSAKKSLESEILCSCSDCQKFETFLSRHDLDKMANKDVKTLFSDFRKDMEDYLRNKTEDSDKTRMKMPALLPKKLGLCENMKLMQNTLKCLVLWQWGTTYNFLYKWSRNIPGDLHRKKFLSLVDAGLEINSAYPLILPPNRKVDLILSFDFSEGDPFKTLKDTKKYCKINGIPFPEISIEEQESEAPSKSCYVFEGDGKEIPSVMHFPLFNDQSCEGKLDEFRKKYSTFNVSYNESDLKELLKTSKRNVELNKDQILDKVQQLISFKSSV